MDQAACCADADADDKCTVVHIFPSALVAAPARLHALHMLQPWRMLGAAYNTHITMSGRPYERERAVCMCVLLRGDCSITHEGGGGGVTEVGISFPPEKNAPANDYCQMQGKPPPPPSHLLLFHLFIIFQQTPPPLIIYLVWTPHQCFF